jgi:DNA/RNA-binding domain of Phe-tRNA-synthetase-like protein
MSRCDRLELNETTETMDTIQAKHNKDSDYLVWVKDYGKRRRIKISVQPVEAVIPALG